MGDVEEAIDRIQRIAAVRDPTEMQRRRVAFDAEVVRQAFAEVSARLRSSERRRLEAEADARTQRYQRVRESADRATERRRRCARMREQLAALTMADLRGICRRECISPGYAGSRKDTLIDEIIRTRFRREEAGI